MKPNLSLSISRQRASGGGAPPAVVPFQSVNADGWSTTYDSPVVASPEPFTASRQGYVGVTPTTVTETLYCTTRVRQPWPNQATLTADRVALSDYIYSTDTLSGATNNSAEASPKPVANWALPDRTVIGNTLVAEVVAFHRNARDREQVAAVEFIATDGTNTVSQVVTESVISGRAGDQLPVIVYRSSLDVSTLASPATITLNAKAYPHIGAVASVLDSAASSVAREFSPRFYRRDTALAAAPVFAYVNATTGNDTTGVVSSTAAMAEASPCLTIAGAINRIIAVSGSVDGHIIRLMAGTNVFSTSAIIGTRAQNAAQLIITRDPNATRAAAIMQFGSTANTRPRLGASGGWLKFEDITINRQGLLAFAGEAASQLRLWFDNLDFDNASNNASMISNAHTMFTGVTATNMTVSPFNAAGAAGVTEHRLFRGLSCVTAANTEGWLVIGCDLRSASILTLQRGGRSRSGSIVAFSRLQGPATSNRLWGPGESENVTGAAFVGNIVEYISATLTTTLAPSADGTTGNNTHIIIHHNTIAGFFSGGRSNLFYDEGPTARTSKLMSVRGNIHTQINTKGDVFRGANEAGPDASTRVGNWAYEFGVGCQAEFSMFIDADSGGIGSAFAQEYPGLDASIGTSSTVRNDPLFVAYAGTTAGPTPGAGGGNYALQAGSPAKGIAQAVLRFDAAGATRTAITSAGAYQ